MKKNASSSSWIQVVRFHGFWFLHWIVLAALLRLLFLVGNTNAFPDISGGSILEAFGFGAWVDSIVAFYAFVPMLLLALLVSWAKPKWGHVFLTWTFRLFGILIIIFTMISATYFPIGKQHIGLSLFQFLQEGNNVDLWVYIKDYFLVYLTALILILTWWVAAKNISKRFSRGGALWHVLCLGLVFFIARGGTRLRPLRNADAANYVDTDYIPLAQNAVLVFADDYLYGEKAPSFVPKNMNCEAADSTSTLNLNGKNVVLFILESFGQEYTGWNEANLPSYTPFLDSLAQFGTSFTHFYASGLKSMDAVPALYSGVPKLSKQSYITLPASADLHSGLLPQLSNLGYTHAFFHGAHPQSMGFQSFLKAVGLDRYYSMNDYPNLEHSGKWGIYDHHFLDLALDKINGLGAPFTAGIFTLSSHHPYEIPEPYTHAFPEGNLPIHAAVGYTDFSVRRFMDNCKKQTWYDSTIFVFLADHSSQNQSGIYQNSTGKYRIPLLLFDPSRPFKQRVDFPYGQPDLGKILHAFVHDDTLPRGRHQIWYDNGQFRLMTDQYSFGMDESGAALYVYSLADLKQENNLLNVKPELVKELRKLAISEIGCAWKKFYE